MNCVALIIRWDPNSPRNGSGLCLSLILLMVKCEKEIKNSEAEKIRTLVHDLIK